MGIIRFALRFPHTFYVLAGLMLFLGCTAILGKRCVDDTWRLDAPL
jgi:hypothetical protein